MHPFFSKYLFYYPVTLLKGEVIAKYLSQYERFQRVPKQEIDSYQLAHLKKLIEHAYSKSGYYKEVFDAHGIGPADVKSLEDIKKLPYLTKNDLATRFDHIVTTNKSLFISEKTTGGSTGQAVTLLKNSDALARERAATWRSYNWAGVTIGDPQARFWGIPLHAGQQIKYSLVDFVANRKRFSAFDINEERLEMFYEQLVKFKPRYLYGYVSVIEIFARFIRDNNYTLPPSVKSVITTSEVLSKGVRKTIESALGVKVFNEYGCGEVGSIAHECEHGEMHVMDDNVIVEILSESEDSADGEIVVTDLFNYATPLIRYKLGDYASLSKKECECGRTLKTISNIHGRAYDCIRTEAGQIFHPEVVMYIFEDIKDTIGGIKQFQVVQENLDSLHIKIVKQDDYNKATEKNIDSNIRSRLHVNMKTRYEYVDEIAREKSGKLRLVKSEI